MGNSGDTLQLRMRQGLWRPALQIELNDVSLACAGKSRGHQSCMWLALFGGVCVPNILCTNESWLCHIEDQSSDGTMENVALTSKGKALLLEQEKFKNTAR